MTRTGHIVTGYTAGQARSGRWWVYCHHPGCDHYKAGLATAEQADAAGRRHEAEHNRERGR